MQLQEIENLEEKLNQINQLTQNNAHTESLIMCI